MIAVPEVSRGKVDVFVWSRVDVILGHNKRYADLYGDMNLGGEE